MKINRRKFLRNAVIGVSVAPMIVSAKTLGLNGKISPSNRINLGFIGLGGQGIGINLKNFLKYDDCHVKMLCDVDLNRLANARKIAGNDKIKDSDCVQDYRAVLDSDQVDAVVISTPDHWHTPMSVFALRKGKHVFCEKPSLYVDEDAILMDELKKSKLIFQTGVEDRSLKNCMRMVDIAQNGYLGKISHANVGVWTRFDRMKYVELKDEKVPDYFDYELWTGPSKMNPYQRERCHYCFRWINDYSSGELLNWGTHEFDIAQLATVGTGVRPTNVKPIIETKFSKGLYDTPYDFALEYTYPNGIKIFVETGGTYMRITGENGWIQQAGYSAVVKASSPKLQNLMLTSTDKRYRSETMKEHRNFLDNVRVGRDLFVGADKLQDMCFALNTGFISLRTNSEIKIDKNGNYIDNPKATDMRKPIYRKQFSIL